MAVLKYPWNPHHVSLLYALKALQWDLYNGYGYITTCDCYKTLVDSAYRVMELACQDSWVDPALNVYAVPPKLEEKPYPTRVELYEQVDGMAKYAKEEASKYCVIVYGLLDRIAQMIKESFTEGEMSDAKRRGICS